MIAWTKRGWVPEWWYRTSKNPDCVPSYDNDLGISREQIDAEALFHLADGYAICDTFDEICEAIFRGYEAGTGGAALVGVNIMEDYQNLMPKTVDGASVYIYPGKSGTDVGGHAQCIVGYDMDQGILVVAASWGDNDRDWPLLNGWTRNYHVANASAAYVPIDASDVAVGRQIYSTMAATCNVPCGFVVNGRECADGRVSVLDGSITTVRAAPLDPSSVKIPPTVVISGSPALQIKTDGTVSFIPNKSQEVVDAAGKPVITVEFTFRPTDPTPPPTPSPNPVVEFLKALWAILKGLLGK
jgi:hypothetical protein